MSRRDALLAELERYAPADEGERAMRDRISAFVAVEPACFERGTVAGHLTASAWIVDARGEAAVLLLHRKLGRWLQPGGHADGDGDLRRVALREATEETGLRTLRFASDAIYDVDVHEIPARTGEPAHLHYDVRFAFVANRDEPIVCSDESHRVEWIELARIGAHETDESVLRLARKTPIVVTSMTAR